jgi:DNA-binding CsgD family transcriptional regulator
MNGDSLNEAIERLYAAILAPERWGPALLDLAHAADADGFHFLLWDETRQYPLLSMMSERPADAERRYAEHFGSIDPHVPIALSTPDNQWSLSQDVLSPQVRNRNEFYVDYLTTIDVTHGARIRTSVRGDQRGMIAFVRWCDRGEFGQQAKRTLEQLKGHINRATALYIETHQLRLQASLASRALDALDYPLFIVDGTARIHFLNAAARALLARDRTFSATGHRLRGRLSAFDQSLQKLIAGATLVTGAQGGVLSVPNADARAALQLITLPLPSALEPSLVWPFPVAVVAVVVPDARGLPPSRVLQQLFGLTAAEVALAIALAEGASLGEFAEERGIALATVRTQLQHVFAKTGVRRQSGLVKLLVELPRFRQAS